MDDEGKYDAVLRVLRDLHEDWRAFQDRTTAEITEYKKTVNSAISILGMEAVKFQQDTRDRLQLDASERLARQQHLDSEAQRREASTISSQQRANRERLGILSGMGCLILLNVIALITLAALLISLYWQRGA